MKHKTGLDIKFWEYLAIKDGSLRQENRWNFIARVSEMREYAKEKIKVSEDKTQGDTSN